MSGKVVGYILAAVIVVVALGAAGELSTRSSTCMLCHTQQADFATWMRDELVCSKKGFSHELIACSACHMQGGAAGTLYSKYEGVLHMLAYFTPQIDPRKPESSGVFYRTRIPSENCQYCHKASIVRKEVYAQDLPKTIKNIGLVMDHRKHVIARDDTCAKCHERYKDQGKGEADKGVNYAEVNHLACDSCHSSAAHSYRGGRAAPLTEGEYLLARAQAWKRLEQNPRWMVAFPTKETCKRCHNGKIHYKTRIFLSDCPDGADYKNCVKCHPLMTKDFFEKRRQKRKVTAAFSGAQQRRTSRSN
jgi:hypothetical protein